MKTTKTLSFFFKNFSNPRRLISFTFVIILVVLGVQGISYGQRLNVGGPRAVRMIYFLPNDRPYQSDVVQKMKDQMVALQTFFAKQMQAHGYGKRTFRFETDAKGKPKVHRVDGQYSDSYYVAKNGGYWEELEQKFDMRGPNIYFVVWDNSTGLISGGIAGIGGSSGKNSGLLDVPTGFSFGTAAHELGHAFGLGHDFRDGRYILSYGPEQNRLSACAAEFLAARPYFNPDIPFEEGPAPTIELISSRTYPAGSKSVTIRLKVSDTDGVHQVLLFGVGNLIACRGLAGKKEAIIEFEYDGVHTAKGYISLSDAVSHAMGVQAVDINGDADYIEFQLAEISQHHIHTFEGHTGTVDSMMFSPDGRMLASGGWELVKLWDVETQQNIATFEGSSVAFSPNGRTLAIGDFGWIKLWDVRTKHNFATLGPIVDGVYSLAFSPNGKMLASGSHDGMIALWDVARHRDIFTFQAYTRSDKWTNNSVISLAFSPDGKMLASGSYDPMIKLWDVATGTNIGSIREEGLAPYIYSLAFSPDGKMLASGRGNGPGNVKLWDVATKRNIAFFDHILEVYSVAFSPEGSILASGSRDGMVTLRDVATGTHIADLPHTSGAWSVAFSPDGSTLASGTRDGVVSFWNLPPRALVAESQRPPLYWIDAERGTLHRLIGDTIENFLPNVRNAMSLAVDIVSGELYWTEKTTPRTGALLRANLNGNPNPQLVKNLTSVPQGLALDTTNRKIYVTNAYGKVQRLNFDGSNFQPNLITGLQTPNHLALDVTRGKIYWTEQTDDRTGKIRRANLDGTNIELVKDLTSVPHGIAVDTVNGKIYLASPYGQVQRLNLNGSNFQPNFIRGLESPKNLAVDVADGKLYWTEKGGISRADLNSKHRENIVAGLDAPANIALGIMNQVAVDTEMEVDYNFFSIAFSPDGNRFATGNHDGTTRLWNANTGKELRVFGGHTGSVDSVAFSPDGVRLATGSADGTARLWEVNTGKQIRVFRGHTEAVTSIAFSPDGTRLATGSRDGTARLWNTNTGKQIRVWDGVGGWSFQTIYSVAFSPNGNQFAIGTVGVGSQIWNTNTGALIRELDTGSVRSLAFHPEGKQLATAGWGEAQLWNTNTGGLIRTFGSNEGTGMALAFSPDGSRIATGSHIGTVRLYNVNTGKRIWTFKKGYPGISSVVFSPNGKHLVTIDADGTALALNANTGKPVLTLMDEPGESQIVSIPDANKVVSIPDANLAKAIRKALELGNNARITNQHMLKLTELEARNRKIKNLTGLEHAKNLTRLYLDRNQIRNLNPLSGLTRLKTLTLDENQISNVGPLTKLTQLDWLLIGGNPIKNAGVRLLAELKHLRGLSLYNSQISNITPVGKLTKLESLWLDYNQIRDVSPLSGLTNLRTLHLRDNQIRDVSPIGKLTQLTSLRLTDNPIADVGPLASLWKLEDVDIEIPPAAPGHVGVAPPEVTSLLENYPNPFNPETWIPYELATDMDVRITIYNAQGVVIRTLELGQQSAGYYTTRSRAAHWDGRNALGEPVASGVYFYTLSTESTRDSVTAGEFTATRKMLVRK
ncbi:MAG: leucine-rich repeat domain-containing protein [Candidatus Poribacteria bacterium]|nr:leucine-rich repeat domain-containing protein [Candidatus Poribacteria bacterium]MDE0424562.1 leucine-rich repeat domain-containing protein [Candidatus Poribacteria bacterium]